MGSNAISGIGKGVQKLAGGFESMMKNKEAFDEKKASKDLKDAALKRKTKREDISDQYANNRERRSAETHERSRKGTGANIPGSDVLGRLGEHEKARGLSSGTFRSILSGDQLRRIDEGGMDEVMADLQRGLPKAGATYGTEDEAKAAERKSKNTSGLMDVLGGMGLGKAAQKAEAGDLGGLLNPDQPAQAQVQPPSGNMYGDGDLFGDPQAMKQQAVQEAAAKATQMDQGPGTEPIDRENAGSLLNLSAAVMDPATDPGTLLRSWMMLHEKFGIPIPMEMQQLMGIMQPEQQMFGGGQVPGMGPNNGMFGPPQGGQMPGRGGL